MPTGQPTRAFSYPHLRQLVEKLREDWAPQQIAGWLKRRIRAASHFTCHTKRCAVEQTGLHRWKGKSSPGPKIPGSAPD